MSGRFSGPEDDGMRRLEKSTEILRKAVAENKDANWSTARREGRSARSDYAVKIQSSSRSRSAFTLLTWLPSVLWDIVNGGGGGAEPSLPDDKIVILDRRTKTSIWERRENELASGKTIDSLRREIEGDLSELAPDEFRDKWAHN